MSGAWDEFIRWGGKFYENRETFERNERDYKVAHAQKVRFVREALVDGRDWLALVGPALAVNYCNQFARMEMGRWVDSDPSSLERALRVLWDETKSVGARIDGYLELVPNSLNRNQLAETAIVLHTAIGVEEFPPYRVGKLKEAFSLTGYPNFKEAGVHSRGERYEYALGFFDRIVEEAGQRDIELRDRLDAQSLAWTITYWEPGPDWTDSEKADFEAYRGGGELRTSTTPSPGPHPPDLTLTSLGNELMIESQWLQRIERLIKDKHQIVFYGPPGTGKTFVARRLAQYLAGSSDRLTTVQFHPSYAYEDFVEGYRPVGTDGQAAFELRPGPLKKTARQAMSDPEHTYVLVIDELNRGNLAKVFGELYLLLEYRDWEIDLQYSDERFGLPDNLLIIGTMNTADRSIALVDAALRRRFYFVPFYPNEAPIEGLLGRWLARHNPDMEWVAGVVDEANRRLSNPHVAIGPSHFMRSDLDDDWVDLIWQHSIMPYIAEQLFGQEERVSEFSLNTLRGRIAPVQGESEMIDREASDAC